MTLVYISHNTSKGANKTRFADGSAINVIPSVRTKVGKGNISALHKLFTGQFDTILL